MISASERGAFTSATQPVAARDIIQNRMLFSEFNTTTTASIAADIHRYLRSDDVLSPNGVSTEDSIPQVSGLCEHFETDAIPSRILPDHDHDSRTRVHFIFVEKQPDPPQESTKRYRKKTRKAPEAPTRARSAFLLFSMDKRPQIKESLGDKATVRLSSSQTTHNPTKISTAHLFS